MITKEAENRKNFMNRKDIFYIRCKIYDEEETRMKKIRSILLLLLFCAFMIGCEKKEKGSPLTILTTSINYESFMKAFQEKYPEVEIQFISYKGYNQTGYIRECFEEGELPDIVTTTYFMDDELQKSQLLDLSKYSFVNNYTDSWLNRCNVDGSIYLLPSNYSAIGFYYNKTILEKYGWNPPKNFQELKELSIEIEKAGLETCCARMDLEGFIFSDFFGLGNTFYFNTEDGASWKKEFLEGTADAKGNIEPVLSYFMDWVEEGYISPNDIGNKGVSDRFYRGETVFMLCNGIGSMSQEIEGVGKMEYGILPWMSQEGESNMIVSNVSRYYGINKKLGEKGQEKRLQDALCFMEFVASEEGMSLLKSDTTTISPLNNWEIDENDMYFEIKHKIIGGNTVPLVYVGWDDLIIPIAEELYQLVRKEQTIEECIEMFDEIRNQWLENGIGNLGVVKEDFSKEEAAYMVGRILMEKYNADASLLSLGEYHGFGKENSSGIQCGIYEGKFNLDRMRTIVPAAKMCLVSLTGEELLSKKITGKYIMYSKDDKIENSTPFPYVLITREGKELVNEKIYKVVISTDDLTEEEKKKIIKEWMPIETQEKMEEYFVEHMGEITKEKFYEWQ